ncbi:MAG: hypothetical protein KBA31_09040 [Alphaproteobacteria bacterium]|nr:hypothetical protein [Alphaproteobacteria bacterium]
MTNATPAHAPAAAPAAAPVAVVAATETGRMALSKEIHAKWGKFSESDVAALKSSDELVTHVVSKYGLDKAIAQRDVDALVKGRTF